MQCPFNLGHAVHSNHHSVAPVAAPLTRRNSIPHSMADTLTGPPAGEKDSGLSMTSNILGIFTFTFAVLLGAWLPYHQWHSAQKELTEFEEYLEV